MTPDEQGAFATWIMRASLLLLDRLPPFRLPRADDRLLHPGDGRRLAEAGLALLARSDRGEELVPLDDLEVVVAEADARARVEMPVIRMRRPGEDGGVALLGQVVVSPELELQLVHTLEIPLHRALRSVELEGHVALGAVDHPAGLEQAPRAVLEMDQGAHVVLVGHVAHRAVAAALVVMGAGSRLRDWPPLDEDLLVGRERLDRSGHHLGHVDHVRHEVPERPQPLRLLEPPGEEAERVARIAVQEAAVIVRELSQLALADELARVLDERRPAVVVADERDGSGLPRGRVALEGLLRLASHRLLAEDVLSRLERGAVDLEVHAVWSGDVHHLHFGIGDHLPPIGGGPLEPEALLRGSGALFHRVAADHQLRHEAAPGEPIRDGSVGPAVDLAHPSHADDADAECLSHSNLLQCSRSREASTQAPSRRLDSTVASTNFTPRTPSSTVGNERADRSSGASSLRARTASAAPE